MSHPKHDLTVRVSVLTNAIAVTRSDEELTQLYIERGHCYNALGDEVRSVRDYVTALDTARSKSQRVHISSMIALALAGKDGQKEQALFWAMSAVDQDRHNAEGYHTLGLVCDVCGFLNVAIEALQRAIGLEPNRWDSIRVLGSCLRENGQIQEAIETLSRYVANNGDEPSGLYELAWSLHIIAGGDVEKLQSAKEMYERALRSNPNADLRTRIERKLGDIRSITD